MSKTPKKANENLQKNSIDVKQLIVGGIILLVAVILILSVLLPKKAPEEPKVIEPIEIPETLETIIEKVKEDPEIDLKENVLVFTATTERPFDFQIFYTPSYAVGYDEGTSVYYPAKQGTNQYRISLPQREIYRIRIDFGSAPGKVTIKEIYLIGAQEIDLNDFSQYSFTDMDNIKIKGRSVSFTSEKEDPFMDYLPLIKEPDFARDMQNRLFIENVSSSSEDTEETASPEVTEETPSVENTEEVSLSETEEEPAETSNPTGEEAAE